LACLTKTNNHSRRLSQDQRQSNDWNRFWIDMKSTFFIIKFISIPFPQLSLWLLPISPALGFEHH
jgi:hypothetical protein